MKVIRVIKKATEAHDAEKEALNRLRVDVDDVSPTLLGAFTSMTIAKALEKHKARLVIVENPTDAMAAISANRIAKNANYKVVYSVRPNTTPPRYIPKEVTQGVDLWIFPSRRLRDTYPLFEKNCYIVEPLLYPDNETYRAAMLPMQNESPVISWIGPINNGARLKGVLETLDNIEGAFSFRICGGGKARDVMPLVKFSRTLRNAKRVEWVGEEYDRNKEILLCDAAVRTDDDLTPLETQVMVLQKPVLALDDIEVWLKLTLAKNHTPVDGRAEDGPHPQSTLQLGPESELDWEDPSMPLLNRKPIHDYDGNLRKALSTITFIE